jgi:hypothetical protein
LKLILGHARLAKRAFIGAAATGGGEEHADYPARSHAGLYEFPL